MFKFKTTGYIKISKALSLGFITCALVISCGGEKPILSSDQEPDPVVVDIPIAYIKQVIPVSEQQIENNSLTQPTEFLSASALFIKPRASASALEVNISDRAFFSEQEIEAANDENPLADYAVKDLEVSYDGSRLLFAMRAPELEDVDDELQPKWNIWQYNRLTDELQRIIKSDIVAEQGHDFAPAYLPDGRIVFSSTRQSTNQAILLDEGKPQYQGLTEDLRQTAAVLHVMSIEGENIEQISFNQSHDLDPTVLSNGKILFSRWDRVAGNNGIHFYQMNSDGSGLEIVYGKHSHDLAYSSQDVQYVQARELPDTTIMTLARPFSGNLLSSQLLKIDIEQYIDAQYSLATGSESPNGYQALLFNQLSQPLAIPISGRFASAYPLWDGSQRLLFSWSPCRVLDPEFDADSQQTQKALPCSESLLDLAEIEEAPLSYGLWMFDPVENTQLTIGLAQPDLVYSEVVAMQERPNPADNQFAEEYSQSLADDNLARVHIRSVYDVAGIDSSVQGISVLSDPNQTPVSQRPVRYLRIEKAVSIPNDEVRDFSNSAFGRSRNQLMREIIGYVPVEPDGSALFDVPANLPLAFSLVDKDIQRVADRHQNWLHFAPGEVRTCNGCHQSGSEMPHGRSDAEAPSINLGATSTGIPFLNTNPELFADFGETMAQTTGRINGVSKPQPNISFSDIWADPAQQTVIDDYKIEYANLQTPLPITPSCAIAWRDLCRIVINYPEHIQPIFELDRRQFAQDDVTLLQDNTCVSCHQPFDEQQSPMVPAGQLDLSSTASVNNADHLTSYRELLFNDNEQELLEGALVDRLEVVTDGDGNIVFETDEDGELILDGEGNPIAVTRTINVRPSMSANGARSSSEFFTIFNQGQSHQGWLTVEELKLISEWLDVGAQYYNNPFAAPVN